MKNGEVDKQGIIGAMIFAIAGASVGVHDATLQISGIMNWIQSTTAIAVNSGETANMFPSIAMVVMMMIFVAIAMYNIRCMA